MLETMQLRPLRSCLQAEALQTVGIKGDYVAIDDTGDHSSATCKTRWKSPNQMSYKYIVVQFAAIELNNSECVRLESAQASGRSS